MRKTLAFATLMLLSACGFQLQGRQVLPERLATVQLQLAERHSDFSKALNRALGASGSTLVPQAAEGGTVVRVLHDAVSERVLSVDARNIPTDIELIYEVEIEVRAGTEELMAPEPFALSRIFSFDERKQLAKEREKDLLREALARDMASVVMRRLASL